MRPSAILVVTLATVQLVAAVASLYFGILILDPAAFPRPGSRAVPALLFCFCLAAVLAGVVLVVRRDLTACRAVALWNLFAGLFFLLALSFARHPLVSFARHPHPEGLIPAASFLEVFIVLIVPLVPCPTAHARNRPVETNSSG